MLHRIERRSFVNTPLVWLLMVEHCVLGHTITVVGGGALVGGALVGGALVGGALVGGASL